MVSAQQAHLARYCPSIVSDSPAGVQGGLIRRDEHDSAEVERRVLNGTFWIVASRWASLLVTWPVTIVLARLLSPADYGYLAVVAVFTRFGRIVAEAGVSNTVLLGPLLSDRRYARLHGWSLLLFLVVGGTIAAFAVPIEHVYKTPGLRWVLLALTSSFMLEGLTLLPIARMRRGVRFRELAVADTARVLCDAGASLLCAINGFGYWSLVAGYLAGHACHAMFILHAAGMRPAWPSTRGLSEPLSNAKRLLVASITNFAAESSDAWVGGAVVGAAALGGYTFMMSLARSPIEKIAGIIAFASGTLLGNLRANTARIGQAVLRLARITSLLIFPAFAGIALVADDLVLGILGPKWHPFVLSLRILCLFFAMQPLHSALDDAAITLGHSKASAMNGVISLLILPVSFFVFGRYLGATGLALAWLVPRPILIARLLLLFNRTTGLRLSSWISCFREPVLGVLLMALVVSGAQRLPGMLALSHLPRLIFLSALGATVYAAFLLIFARADVLWLRGLIKR